MKMMKRMLLGAAVAALGLCANRAEAGLPYGGSFSGEYTSGAVLQGDHFYNLTDDTTIDLRESKTIQSAMNVKSGTVLINLNGYNLSLYGAPGQGQQGGAAGLHLPGGASVYIVGHGTFYAYGGNAGAGAIGEGGHNGEGDGEDRRGGAGGAGGVGGGGAGAGVGTDGAVGGAGGNGGGQARSLMWQELDGNDGKPGYPGGDPDSNVGLFYVNSNAAYELYGGLGGTGGGGSGCGQYVYEKYGALYHWSAAGGGGGGGGGGGAAAPGYGSGGYGGGGGGGGGGGAVNVTALVLNQKQIGGGYGGRGGLGYWNGADGPDAGKTDNGDSGYPGAAGAGGAKGADPVDLGKPKSFSTMDLAAATFAVALDLQGGTSGSTSVLCYLGEATATVAEPASRTGYVLDGYFTGKNGTGVKYFDGKGQLLLTYDGTATQLYANWTPITYNVVYDANGGLGAVPVPETWTYDVGTKTAAPNTLTVVGHTFVGWNTAANGTGKALDANTTAYKNLTATADATVTLYAQWAAAVYVLTLPDGTKVSATYGQRAPNVPPATKTGYTFNGYGDADGNTYYDADGKPTGETWATTSDVSLVPLFTANSYTVTLPDGTKVNATYDQRLPDVTPPVKTGYTFAGYADENGTMYYNAVGTPTAEVWTTPSDVTLVSTWTANTYTVTLDAQGGAGGTPSVVATYDAVYPKVGALPTLTGHTFLGYYEGTDEEAAAIYNSRGVSTNVYEKLADSTLWAKWKANTYTLSLDGGSFSGKVSVTYGTCPAPVRVPFREGYEFRGYVNGENVMIYGADGKSTLASYETAADQDLTALWGRLPEELVLKSAKQRWPWNGKYDVTYEVGNLDPEKLYSIAGDFTLGETSGTVFADIPTESGEGTVMLDAGGIFPAGTLTDEATLTLRLVIRKQK